MKLNPKTDFLVDVANPAALDHTLQAFGAVLIQDGVDSYYRQDGHYVVRCLGDPGMVKFVMESQGYGHLVLVREDNDGPATV